MNDVSTSNDEHTFIAKTKRGKVGVFVRKEDEGYPIRELFGPSIPSTFREQRIQKRLARLIQQNWRPTFDRELAGYLRKFNAGK